MTSTVFQVHPNNVTTTLASAYTAGSGSLVLASGTGALFGSTFPMTVTVVSASTYGSVAETYSIYTVTGRSTDTLTGVTVTESTTDRAYAIGDRVEVRWTSGLAQAIEGAVNNIQAAAATDSLVVHLAGTETIAGMKNFSAASFSGNVSMTGNFSFTGGGWTNSPNSFQFLRGDGNWAWMYLWSYKTANYTMGANDTFVGVSASAGNITLTLPSAASAYGREFIISRIDSTANSVTVQCAGTDSFIGASSTFSIPATITPGVCRSLRVLSSQSQWIITGAP